MTRAMLVQVLYRMSGSKAASTAQFTDVADGKWYAEAIAWASENGIVNGFTDGRFQPDTLITRQQLAAILYRYDTYRGHTPQGSAALDGYADAASVESWAAEAMSWANGNGLVTGVTPDYARAERHRNPCSGSGYPQPLHRPVIPSDPYHPADMA